MSFSLRESKTAKIVISIIFLLVIAFAGSVAYGLHLDSKLYGIIPANTSIAGVDVSGMTRDEAKAALDKKLSDASKDYRLKLNAKAGDELLQEEELSLQDSISYEVDEQLDEALAPAMGDRLQDKVQRLITHLQQQIQKTEPPKREIMVRYHFDAPQLEEQVAKLAEAVKADPVDAQRSISGDKVTIIPEQTGRSLDLEASLAQANEKLAELTKDGLPSKKTIEVDLPITSIEPSVLSSSFGQTITINLSSHKLHLFNGDKLVKTYTIGCGKPGYETPTGLLKIVNKRRNPRWVNPDPEGWGANMPAVIEPGPGNPLGLRALDLNRPAIRIHGVTNLAKLGVSDSHGCINMSNNDVVDLFDRVGVNTPVNVHY